MSVVDNRNRPDAPVTVGDGASVRGGSPAAAAGAQQVIAIATTHQRAAPLRTKTAFILTGIRPRGRAP